MAQRVSSDLRLNPPLHAIVMDGVFAPNKDAVDFHSLKSLDDSDVADLLPVIRVRVVNWLVRRGIVQGRDDLTLDAHDDVDPGLAQLSRAAVSGSIPAGPEIHQRPPVSLRGQSEARPPSLHTKTPAPTQMVLRPFLGVTEAANSRARYRTPPQDSNSRY